MSFFDNVQDDKRNKRIKLEQKKMIKTRRNR